MILSIVQFCVVIAVVFILDIGPAMLHIVLVCCSSTCFSILLVTYSHVSSYVPVLRGDRGGVHPGGGGRRPGGGVDGASQR